MIPCIQANKLTDLVDFSQESVLPEAFNSTKVVLINEAQFFEDIVQWVTTAVEKYNKSVYICGLNSDFQRQPFGNWLDLQQICDKVTHLHSWCGICKKQQALFSHRLSGETDKIVIGADNYIPVCRTCWLGQNTTF
jgi:thymidine kinase